jgi:hypothetical protein
MTRLSDPAELFHVALAAWEAGDWLRLAELCDPDSLRVFRRSMVAPILQPPSPRTVEEVFRNGPELSAEEAAAHVAALNRSAAPHMRLKADFPTVESIDALAAMTSEQVFAAWLHGRAFRTQAERAYVENGASEEQIRQLRDRLAAVPLQQWRLLGVAHDGPDIAHLVYRETLAEGTAPDYNDWTGTAGPVPEGLEPGAPPAEAEAAFLRATSGRGMPMLMMCRRADRHGWRLVADHGVFAMGLMMYAVDPLHEQDDEIDS